MQPGLFVPDSRVGDEREAESMLSRLRALTSHYIWLRAHPCSASLGLPLKDIHGGGGGGGGGSCGGLRSTAYKRHQHTTDTKTQAVKHAHTGREPH